MTALELHSAEREAETDATTPYDDDAFGVLVERHRHSLRGHCYRMLQSPDQADDAVQETLLHAWRARHDFAGRAKLGSWLHRIATNVCLDELARRQRRTRPHRIADRHTPVEGCAEGQPDIVAPCSTQPDGVVVARDSLTQACLTVFMLLPPRQRAVLMLRDVLRWPAGDTATSLGTSVAAVNSTLQRARATLHEARSNPGGFRPARTALTANERILLHRYVDAIARPDPTAAVAAARLDLAGAPGAAEDAAARHHGSRPQRRPRVPGGCAEADRPTPAELVVTAGDLPGPSLLAVRHDACLAAGSPSRRRR